MNNNFTNIFGEGFKDMMNPENLAKSLSNNTHIDFTKLSANMKKSSEAIQEASHVAAESVQSIFKRTSEIVQENANHMLNAMKEVASSGDPEQAIARHQHMLQNFVHNAVSNTKEMAGMISKSTMEVFDKISKHSADHNACSAEDCTDGKKGGGKK